MAALDDGCIEVWKKHKRKETFKKIFKYKAHNRMIGDMVIFMDKYLVTCCNEGFVKCWNLYD